MKKRNAFTLVEVVVSILISATVALSVFMIFTSTAASQKKAKKKELAALAIKMVQEQLKSYVTSDTTWQPNPNSWPGAPWRFCNARGRCDTCNCWALQGGPSGYTHTITSVLQDEPFLSGLCNGNIANCTFTYTVFNRDCGFGTADTYACKEVNFRLVYPDD